MARVRLNEIVKTYGEDTVVDHVSLSIEEGEFVVLLGPSGCGKTTMLRMIAGLETITAGELWIDDDLMNKEPPSRRSVGMVFQNYALYPHMTVGGNLSFGLQSRRRTGSRRAARQRERAVVQRTAELLELEHLLDHRPKELSGGQRQRVALGRALIREPGVFLMDEPLSNLDAQLRDRMRMELARLHEQLQVTTIYVTHDQGEALTLADRVIVMHDGRVRQAGTAASVYDSPADTFVAGFIGAPGMNLVELRMARDAPRPGINPRVHVADPHLVQRCAATDALTVGVRPEHLYVTSSHESSAIDLTCRIEMIEHLGSHVLVHATLDGNVSQPVVARLERGSSLRRGDHLKLGASAEHIHLFDAETGLRLPEVDRTGESNHQPLQAPACSTAAGGWGR